MYNNSELKIEIKCLSEFIKLLEDESYADMYFRGQPRDYSQKEPYKDSGIVASCYRKAFKHNTNDDLNNMLDEYYFNLGHQLNEIDKNNFLAYAQHHGLPTNLIDISSVSLVALYFACEKTYYDNEHKGASQDRKNDGYVYVIKKDKFINISNQVSSRRIYNFYDELLQEGLYKNGEKSTLILFNKILQNYLELDRGNFCEILKKNVIIASDIIISNREHFLEDLSPLIDEFNHFLGEKYVSHSLHCEIMAEHHLIIPIIKRNIKPDLPQSIYGYADWLKIIMENILVQLYPEKSWYSKIKNPSKEMEFYGQVYDFNYSEIKNIDKSGIMSVCFLTFFIFILDRVCLNETFKMPNFPYMLYKPDINFDRIRLQSGHFIYQNALYYTDNFRHEDVVVNDPIKPDRIITIKNENKSKILKELDQIGINKMTLFEDPDKYADYLREKYQKNKL